MTSSVALDGFPLIGATPAGGTARLVGSDGLDGWFNKALRRNREDRSQQDGSWPSTGFASGLPVVLKGQIVYPDAATAALERRQMLALGGREASPLTVVDALGEGTRMVEVDTLSVVPVRDSMVTFAFAVTATDPLLYGPEWFAQTSLASIAAGTGLIYPLAYPLDYGVPPGVTPGAIILPNAGTASYYPHLQIDGPVPNPVVSLAETGDQITYSGTVPVGQFLDVDCARRRVMLAARSNPTAGVSMRHLVSSVGNWCAVPVNGGSLSWTADAADPAATLSAWAYEGAWE